uniref:Sushi domain-containing protein n=1 Tax=Chelydra serpentina TaxID=8475 RepID=A0A8C3SV85_CHESE
SLTFCFHFNFFIYFCIEMTCDPPAVTNGAFQPPKSVFREKDVIRVDCNRGFHFETDNREKTAECTKNGWLPIPRCILEIKACGPPPSIINGNIISELHEKYQHADSVEYDCSLRFKMIGSKNIECVDGEWSSSPFCIGNAINVNQNQYFHGDSVEYGCEGNLEIAGTNIIKCLSGEWTSLPSCAGLISAHHSNPALNRKLLISSWIASQTLINVFSQQCCEIMGNYYFHFTDRKLKFRH